MSFPQAARCAGAHRYRSSAAVVVIALSMISGCSGVQQPTRYDESVLQRDVEAITELGVTGVQARAVDDAGRSISAVSGVAATDTGRPVPRDGYFRIASATKPLVATVVLQLAGEGRLSLDDSVETYLPGVVRGTGAGQEIDGRMITLRQLLQNSSGLLDDYPGFDTKAQYYEHRFDIYSRDELIRRAMAVAPAFEPGQGWAYSNTNFLLAESIIESVTGNNWQEEIEQRIFRPLDMRHSVWPEGSTTLPGPHARAYSVFAGSDELVDTTEIRDGAENLISTTADMNTFYRALLGGELLRPTELREMQRTVAIDEGTEMLWPGGRYGLGLVRRPLPCGGEYWGHGGGDAGYITSDGVTPDGKRSVVVSQTTALPEKMLEQEAEASELVAHALCGA
ncbi:serine hydrolase domain-containing protein [Nocardia carnea]|uniref:serine hydrolase domain-containing protein n=1 Tax=Nocardia carnea TaxID=37328 RepID=UPI0024544F45|nr:serine hydrolase domain-containing protein [Nocardia carnea]